MDTSEGQNRDPIWTVAHPPVGRTSADHATTPLNGVLNLEIQNIYTFLSNLKFEKSLHAVSKSFHLS